ncbi:hypothetical protein CAMRE0001_0151 [Campylobacter rectus RM3267]|uniref:Uncharacterized protein n=1 Tax=Campylobacter rectus RM3267 TaxID=553218 RepID=B9CXW0_CAMRE|nr:hypothetical protein CAMRE0001_0151 [Campylobacter rectus RM3267]
MGCKGNGFIRERGFASSFMTSSSFLYLLIVRLHRRLAATKRLRVQGAK